MGYYSTKEIASISICATLWGVLNTIFAPMFFQISGLPILCDLIGFSILIFASWWIRKVGSITLIGFIATAINFILRGSFHFLGFTIASIFFDIAIHLIGYDISFKTTKYTIAVMMSISITSAAIAGFIIASFFMPINSLVNWGGALGWAALHSIGGIIGGTIGIFLIFALNSRKVLVNNQKFIMK